MNIIQLFSSCAVVAGFWLWEEFAAPTAVRTGPTTITVTGADYAGITPDAPSIQVDTGTRLSMSMGQAQAWTDETTRVIVYTVDAETDYTIRAFTVEPLATVAEQFDFELTRRKSRLAMRGVPRDLDAMDLVRRRWSGHEQPCPHPCPCRDGYPI